MIAGIFGLGAPEILAIFVVVPLLVGGTALWLWALVDCLRNESSEGNTKVAWVLVILLTHWLGGLLYVLVRRPKRIQELGR